jgi:hypothetical protein
MSFRDLCEAAYRGSEAAAQFRRELERSAAVGWDLIQWFEAHADEPLLDDIAIRRLADAHKVECCSYDGAD